jgi:hypothetical protein
MISLECLRAVVVTIAAGTIALSLIAVIISWYRTFIYATRAYIGSGDYEAWREFVKRASGGAGLGVFMFTLMETQAVGALIMICSDSRLTFSVLTRIVVGVVVALLVTTLFFVVARWRILRREERIIQSIIGSSNSSSIQSRKD